MRQSVGDLQKYSFSGLLSTHIHHLMVTVLMNWKTIPNSRQEFLEELCQKIFIDRNDMFVVERHLCYYWLFLLKREDMIPPILYLFEFKDVDSIPLQYLSLDSYHPESVGVINKIKSHPKFAAKEHFTKERMKYWFNRLQEDGYVDCKDFFQKVFKSESTENEPTSKKTKKNNSTRYSFDRVAVYFLFGEHSDLLKRVNINNKTYIILEYLHTFYSNYIHHHQSYHHQIIINNIHIKREEENVHMDTSDDLNFDQKTHHELIMLLEKAIENEKLTPNTFFFKYLKEALLYLNSNDKRGFRWSPDILCYANDLLHSMGYNMYEAIGRGYISGSLDKEEKYSTSAENCNLIFPSSSTLDNHFHQPNVGYGDTVVESSEFKHLKDTMKMDDTIGVLQVDAMDLFPSLSINRKSGLLIGAVQGPICISASHTITDETIQQNFLSEKVVQTLYTDIEGKIRIPGNFQFCKTESTVILDEVITKFEEVYINQITCTISDAGGPNWSYFTNNPPHLHHFCYSHLCKNIRNAINSKPKFYPVYNFRQYVMSIIPSNQSIQLQSERSERNMVKLSFFNNNNILDITLVLTIGDSIITIDWCEDSTIINNNGEFSHFYTVNSNQKTLSLTIISDIGLKVIPNITINNLSADGVFFTSIDEHVLQRFELKTLDEIYQSDPMYWSKIVKRSSFINFDDQSENILREICSPTLITELEKLNEKTNQKYVGIYSYLKFIHDIFHVYDDVDKLTKKSKNTLVQVLNVLQSSLKFLNEWDAIFNDVNSTNKNNNFTIFGTFTKKTIAHNLETITKLIPIIPSTKQPLLTIFGTRSLEGFFGEQRVYSKRTTVMEYINRYSSLKFQYFKKECVNLPYKNQKKRKYTDEQLSQREMNSELFIKYLHEIKKKIEIQQQPFSPTDFEKAQNLQLLCVKYRVNTIRQSYHQLRYNNSDEIIATPHPVIIPNTETAHFEISDPQPLNLPQNDYEIMMGVTCNFIMNSNSLIHLETNLPAFTSSNSIELALVGLPIGNYSQTKVSLQNTPKKTGTPYLEKSLNHKLYYNNQTHSYHLNVEISSTTSTIKFTKKIILYIGNKIIISPEFFFYRKKTKALGQIGTFQQSQTNMSQNLSQFCESQ